MDKNPLISVVLPVYNREKFIAEAVESMLDQTYSNFELLIIDDGSTDDTFKIINSFRDERIRVIKLEKNGGVANAINVGFRLSQGTYIARMDSDDISVPERLKIQLDVMLKNPELVVCGSWIKILNSDGILKFKEFHSQIAVDMLRSCALSMGTSFLNYKKLAPLLLKKNLRHGEDYEFWSRAIWKGEFYNLQQPLLLYRLHEDQISSTYKKDQTIMDVQIRLTLLKALCYSTLKFPDELLIKVFLFNQKFTVNEFKIFLEWLDILKNLNNNRKKFQTQEFQHYIEQVKKSYIQRVFFQKSDIGINKIWRLKIFLYLPMKNKRDIVSSKIREYKKQKV